MIYWITNVNDILTLGASEEAPINSETFDNEIDQELRYDELLNEIESTKAEIENIQKVSYDHIPLRIFKAVEKYVNPLTTDFTILGFKKTSPSYDRGRKIVAKYVCLDTGQVVVEKLFNDIRNSDGILTALQVTFNWYSEDDTIGLTKTEVVKSFNRYEAETYERKIRYRQFDYLRASVKGTPNEPYINILMNHYSSLISNYENSGNLALDAAMLSETDPTILAILSAPGARNDGLGYTTVLKAIRYQIGTIGLSEL